METAVRPATRDKARIVGLAVELVRILVEHEIGIASEIRATHRARDIRDFRHDFPPRTLIAKKMEKIKWPCYNTLV